MVMVVDVVIRWCSPGGAWPAKIKVLADRPALSGDNAMPSRGEAAG